MNLRRRIARRLGYWADRLAPEDAFRRTGISFEFVTHKGIVTNTEGHGCPLWYQGHADYEKAHARQTERDRQEEERQAALVRDLETREQEPETCRSTLDNRKVATTAGVFYFQAVPCERPPEHTGMHQHGGEFQWNHEWARTTTPGERAEWGRKR